MNHDDGSDDDGSPSRDLTENRPAAPTAQAATKIEVRENSRRGGLPTDTVVVFTLPSKRIFRWFALVVLLALLAPGAYFGKKLHRQWIKDRAQTLVTKGLGALAAEVLDPWRGDFVSNIEDCKMILRAYDLAYRIDSMQWAAESCMEARVESADVIIAMGQVYLAHGEYAEGGFALSVAAMRYKDVRGMLMYVDYLKGRDQPEEAAHTLENAIINLPHDNRIILTAIKTNLELKRYRRAGELAETALDLLNDKKIPEGTQVVYEALGRAGRQDVLDRLAQKTVATVATQDPNTKANTKVNTAPPQLTLPGSTAHVGFAGGLGGVGSSRVYSPLPSEAPGFRPYGHEEPRTKPLLR